MNTSTITTYSVRGSVRGTLARNVSLFDAIRIYRADHGTLDQDRSQLTRSYSDAKIERDDGADLTEVEMRKIHNIED